MLAKTLKTITTLLKTLAVWPVSEPCILYEYGVFSAHNLRNVALKYDTNTADTLRCAIPISKLSRVLALCKPSDDIEISTAPSGSVILSNGSHQYSLGDPVSLDKFPEIFSVGELETMGSFEHWPLKEALPMMSQDEGRPHLNAVQLEANEDGLKIATTDGHRLFHRVTPTSAPLVPGDFLVPGVAANLLTKLSPELAFAWGEQGAVFLDGPWQLLTKRADARFPPYEKIIPRGPWDWILEVDRSKALGSCKAVKIGVEYVHVRVTPGGVMTLKCSDQEGFEAESEIHATVLDGDFPELPMGFNLRYLTEALTSTEHNKAIMKGHGLHDGVDIGGDNVVMPMCLEPEAAR